MSNKALKLPGHPSLMPGESLASFLVRLARANFYDPPSILTRLILDGEPGSVKDSLSYPRQASTFERIATLTGIEARELYAATPHALGRVLTFPANKVDLLWLRGGASVSLLPAPIDPTLFRPARASQFCPKCLGQAAYHRLIWLPVVTSVCLDHDCLLVHQCHACHRRVSVRDIVEAHCGACRANLRRSPAVPVANEFGRYAQTLVQAWLSRDVLQPPDLHNIPAHPPCVLYRVLHGLRFSIYKLVESQWSYLQTPGEQDNDLKGSSQAGTRSLTPRQSYCVYTTALKSLTRWPAEFYRLLDALYPGSESKVRNTRIRQDLGLLYSDWFERNWQYPQFDFIQNAFDNYLADHYSLSRSIQNLGRVTRYPELVERFSFVSLNHASEMLGVSPSTIQKLISVGLLTSYPGNAEGSSICYVKKPDLEKLRRSWSFLLNLGELAKKLGVSEDVTLDMVKAGLFSIGVARAHVFSEWKFGEIAIQKFISKVQDRTALFPVDDPILPFAPMTLTEASRKLATAGLNAALILERVAEGKLPAYRYASRAFFCGEILFDPSDISKCSGAVKVENNWLARAEVAKRLKIKDSTLARWVKARLITPIAYRAGAQYFNRDEVEKFAADHLTSQEAAEFLEVGELTVQRWARQGRLEAVSGPEIDGCHAYRFKRKYLMRWKEERLSFGQAVQLLGVSSSTLHRWIAERKIAPREDMGGKQRWFTRQAVLELHIQLQQSLLLAQTV